MLCIQTSKERTETSVSGELRDKFVFVDQLDQ